MLFDVDTLVEEIREKILKASLPIDLCIVSGRNLSLEDSDEYLCFGLFDFDGVFLALSVGPMCADGSRRRIEMLLKSEQIKIEIYTWFRLSRRWQITSWQEWQKFLAELPSLVSP